MATEIYRVKTFDQIYDAMKRYLIGESSSLNNFNEGSRLSVLLKAMAQILSQTQSDFYQGMKNAIPVAIYNGFDFSRLPGTKAAGMLEFTRSSPAAEIYTVPVGSAFILNGIKFETIQAGSIPIGGTTTGQLQGQCSNVGVAGNIASFAIDTSIGQGSFINQPNGVEAGKNPVAFTGGSDEETDDQRAERFRIYVNSLSRSNVQGLIAGALSVSGVKSVTVVEFLPMMGWVTMYIDDGTGTVSPALQAEVEKVINGDPNDPVNYPGYRAAGIQVLILAPIIVTLNVTVDIKILTSSLSDDPTLRSLAKTAIEQYVNALRLGNDFVLTEMVTAIHNSHTDIFDVQTITPIANVPIPSDSVARTGTVTVTSTRVTQ